jgi:RNA polymerase sigma factor (sigma-70 family)
VPLPPFEDVVARHGPTVLRVCRALLGWERAEDAWAETFLAALKAYPDLPSGSNVEAWLVTIARRKAIDQHRATVRQPVPLPDLPDRPAVDRYPVETDRDLWQALAELPFKQREAVTYHYLAGLPYLEVAQILGNSTDAARRAAADGIKTLRHTYLKDQP